MSTSTVSRVTFGGKTFSASARTIAHLKWTRWRLRARYPWARLVIIQPSYNNTVDASAGTHDKDAVFDVRIVGLTWKRAQAFLRWSGWAAWWRHTGQWSDPRAYHIHMISIPAGVPDNSPTLEQVKVAFRRQGTDVGIYVPGQVDDYYAHALGLKGQHRVGSDPSPFPPNINKTVFKG